MEKITNINDCKIVKHNYCFTDAWYITPPPPPPRNYKFNFNPDSNCLLSKVITKGIVSGTELDF